MELLCRDDLFSYNHLMVGYFPPILDFCMGQQSGELHVGGSLDGALEDLRSRYCGCKYIDGGVDIFIPENSRSLTQNDLNFLYHLEEIKDVIRFNKFPSGSEILLPNLIRIRGVTTTPEGFSLSLVDSDVTQFVLPKLREISNGVVEVNNSTWCGYNTVNWEDIVESQSPKLVITPENFTLHLQQECTDNSEYSIEISIFHSVQMHRPFLYSTA